jgi:hypothetical protein
MIEAGFLFVIGLCAYASYKAGFNNGVVEGIDGTIKHFAKHGLFLSEEMKKALDEGEE